MAQDGDKKKKDRGILCGAWNIIKAAGTAINDVLPCFIPMEPNAEDYAAFEECKKRKKRRREERKAREQQSDPWRNGRP